MTATTSSGFAPAGGTETEPNPPNTLPKASQDMALIADQKLRIARQERQLYGQCSERAARLIDQLALVFEELGAEATEDELAAEAAIARTIAALRDPNLTSPERDRIMYAIHDMFEPEDS
jgi:hypothetical protein